MLIRCDRSVIVLPIGLVDKGHAGMFGVRSGVFGPDKFVSVGSTVEDRVAFSMASLAADIRVSSSVSIALSEIYQHRFSPRLPIVFAHPAWLLVRSGNSS